MAKKSQIDRAIDAAQGEIDELQRYINRLRANQTAKPTRAPRKPRAKKEVTL